MDLKGKESFLEGDLAIHLRTLDPHIAPYWGKMSAQQMVEHFTDAVRTASGRLQHKDIVTPAEHLDRMRAFILSDKPFRENTLNPLMSETPPPVRQPGYEQAVNRLEKEIDIFFHAFKEQGLAVSRNPIFGDLNYEENVHLLYKHALHHLRQFGLTLPAQTA